MPNKPFSPLCGFKAPTAMRGCSMPARRIIVSAKAIASLMRGPVIWSIASRNDRCPVTRDIHWPSSTFISAKWPLWPIKWANILCSSANFQPP